MKGISAVIATILMLMITIALAGLAYTYIIGMWGGRTGVVLSIEAQGTKCIGNTIIVAVRNDGSLATGAVTIKAYMPNGTQEANTGTIASIAADSLGTTSFAKAGAGGYGAGTYTLSATATGGSTTGDVVCSS